MILDDVDQDIIPENAHLQRDCMSPNHYGTVLLTTRTSQVAATILGGNEDILEVGPMNQKNALVLLDKKLECPISNDAGKSIVQMLDFVPLAIGQAAICININSHDGYISHLQEIMQSAAGSLGLSVEALRNSTGQLGLPITWQMVYSNLPRSAATLLSIMSFFDPQNIPKVYYLTMIKAWTLKIRKVANKIVVLTRKTRIIPLVISKRTYLHYIIAC